MIKIDTTCKSKNLRLIHRDYTSPSFRHLVVKFNSLHSTLKMYKYPPKCECSDLAKSVYFRPNCIHSRIMLTLTFVSSSRNNAFPTLSSVVAWSSPPLQVQTSCIFVSSVCLFSGLTFSAFCSALHVAAGCRRRSSSGRQTRYPPQRLPLIWHKHSTAQCRSAFESAF